jgi:GT2 family glycosyltransferase
MTTVSIVIPTRARPAYLEVALASIGPAAAQAAAEVLVVDDAGPSQDAAELAARFGARYQPHPRPLGLNVARNTGVAHSSGELIVFVDDDIRACPGWLDAIVGAAREHPDVDVFTGPIRVRLEGRGGWGSRSCGVEHPPITALDLGARDTDAPFAWGANMAIRRSALQHVGPFDVSLEHGGDEQEWQERLRALTPGARVLYVAAAAVEHRRAGEDTRLRPLARTAYARGRAARRLDVRRAHAPALGAETHTLARCIAHVLARGCPAGLTMVAHSAGRLREGLREAGRSPGHATGGDLTRARDLTAAGGALAGAGGMPGGAPRPSEVAGSNGQPTGADDFLSGTSGVVGGLDARLRAVADEAVDGWERLSSRHLRLGLAARHAPPLRRVLVLGVERHEHRALAHAMRAELLRSRHDVQVRTRPPLQRGKFENLNLLLRAHPVDEYDWLLVIDDDVELSPGFLDRFLFLCERFQLLLAQPAHRLSSHAAWPVTRRRWRSVARETGFVEIGPVTAFARATFPVLLPFPELRMGWGLDAHWAALARRHGWRCGVIDAVSIRHSVAPVAAAYPREDAIAEARSFLAQRPYLSAREAALTLATHRHW